MGKSLRQSAGSGNQSAGLSWAGKIVSWAWDLLQAGLEMIHLGRISSTSCIHAYIVHTPLVRSIFLLDFAS